MIYYALVLLSIFFFPSFYAFHFFSWLKIRSSSIRFFTIQQSKYNVITKKGRNRREFNQGQEHHASHFG